MHSAITKWRMPNVEIPYAKAEPITTLIWVHLHLIKLFLMKLCPLNPDPHWGHSRYGTNRNKLCIQFRLPCHRPQPIERYSAVSVWEESIQSRNFWPFRLSPLQCLLICVKKIIRVFRCASYTTHQILMVGRSSLKNSATTTTRRSIHASNTQASLNDEIFARINMSLKRLQLYQSRKTKGKKGRTVTRVLSDHPLVYVVLYVTQCDPSISPVCKGVASQLCMRNQLYRTKQTQVRRNSTTTVY